MFTKIHIVDSGYYKSETPSTILFIPVLFPVLAVVPLLINFFQNKDSSAEYHLE